MLRRATRPPATRPRVERARVARRLAAAAAVIALLVAPAASSAQTPADLAAAKQAFKDAEDAEHKGDWAGALAKFQWILGVKSTPQIHLRAGACEEKLGRLVDALASYERGRDKARAASLPAVEKVAKEQIDALKPKIPTIALTTSAAYPGLVVKIDGKAIASAALADQLPVDPGKHVVRAEAVGHAPFEREITLAEAAREKVEIHLVALSRDKPVEARSRVPGAAALGAGGALLAVGVTLFAYSFVKDSAVDDLCGGPERNACPEARRAAIESGVSTVNTLRGVGGVLGGVGLAGAVVGAVLLVRASAPPTKTGWFVRVGPAAIAAGGRF